LLSTEEDLFPSFCLMTQYKVFLSLLVLMLFANLAFTPPPNALIAPLYDDTGPGDVPPDDDDDGGGVIRSITQIFHHLVFPAETISEALTGIFNRAAKRETRKMGEEVARWTGVLGEIVQAPSQGDYSRVAQSSLPVAAALAPALFLLRLALYHWGKLLGDSDDGLRVVGDWLTAGALAVSAGPFLDLVIRLGWWMVGKVIGEAGGLAMEFVRATTATSAILGLANLTFLGGLISIGLSLGSLLALAGLLFSFAAANAVLFILAVLAPPVAIASVLPQVRWLRALWIKAVLLIALLPVVAGGIFKAGLSASALFTKGGLLSAVIRLIWLWGATGFLLSLSGILSKMTLSASGDAVKGMVNAAKQIVSIGALAASGIGAVGAGAGAAGAGAAGSTGATTGLGAASMSASAGGLGGSEAAFNHLGAAQSHSQQAAAFDALGLQKPASFHRSQAHQHELAARQAELGERMQRFGGPSPSSPSAPTQPQSGGQDFGFSSSVNASIGQSFGGSPTSFQQGFHGLSPHIQSAGLDPQILAAQYPEDTSRMVQAYLDHSETINAATNPLQSAMRLGNVEQLGQIITFRAAAQDDDTV
jgi:hypothetical protein